MRRKNRLIAVVCILGLLASVIVAKPVPASAAVAAVTGDDLARVVPFAASGKYTDTLDNFDHAVYQAGVSLNEGKITGPGELIYSAGSSEFAYVKIAATFNKWSLNFDDNDLKVYEAVYDEGSGSFVDGAEVKLLRQLRPDLMGDISNVQADYVTGRLSPGTKYVHIVLPNAAFFADNTKYGDFSVKEITFGNEQAGYHPVDYMIDGLADLSHVVNEADGDNLLVNNMADIWAIRTFAALSFVERKDATVEDHAMTYAAPEGKQINTVYAEGYYNFIPSKAFEVWTSQDGVTYNNATSAANYAEASFSYNGNWNATVLKINNLPDGTNYVQVRLPAYTADELWGMLHPRMTKVALGIGEPGTAGGTDPAEPAEPTEEPPVVYPKETGIHFTENAVNVDGIMETDENGAPTGDWQGALAEEIAGTTDQNGYSHSANVYLQYDYDNLYVAAQIKDPTPMINPNTGTNIWGGDNLELFLGTEDLDYKLFPNKKPTMLQSDVQVVLSGGTDNGPQFYLYENGEFATPNIEMQVRQDADGKGYLIEASIPLSALGIEEPWGDKKMIMNTVLNDGGYERRGQWGWTTNDEASKKSRGLWGLASFEPTSGPQAEISSTATVLPGTTIVTVSGQTADVKAQDVTILVTDSNGSIAYIDQAPSSAEGSFTFEFPINSDQFGSGLYTVTVGGDGIKRTGSTTFELASDTTAPADAAQARVEEGDGRLTVSWTDPADADFDHVRISRDGHALEAITVDKGARQAVITGLDNGQEYELLVQSVDFAGNRSNGIMVKGTPIASFNFIGVPGGSTQANATLVDLKDKKPDAGGNLAVELAKEADTLLIQADQASLVGSGALLIHAGDQTVSVPAELLKDALKLADGTDLSGYRIAIHVEAGVDGEQEQASLSKLPSHIQAKSAGQAITVGVSLIDKDGKAKELNPFSKPIVIQLPLDTSKIDEELAGIYVFNSQTGVLEYAGGKPGEAGSSITAEAAKPGYYQLLEYRKTYADVPDGHWAKRAIDVLSAKHIANGVTDTAFDPGKPITRAEFAKLLAGGLGLKASGPSSFDDVDPNRYYADAVSALAEAGLIHGRGTDTFAPDEQITREEMIVLIVRAYEYATGVQLTEGNPSSFADAAAISEWARDAIHKAKEAGLVLGKPDNRLDPSADSSRAECAKLLYSFLNKLT